ncbi:Pseudouridine synthase RluC/RluD, partial [Penicillium cf. griseofulvum]
LTIAYLAPSPRITAYLLRQGKLKLPNMAIMKVDQVTPSNPVEKTPDVLVTPCDPWPAPYYLDGGFRRVTPYHYTYNTNCKERWRGRQLVEIFTSEFRDRKPEYYRKALEDGLVQVNGVTARPETTLKNGQVISHTLHRHEPPVTSLPIGIIYEDDDLMVIDKPAGVPVHAAGRYHFNTVVEILRSERSSEWLPRPCNRLDRLTSGIMFIGKHPQGAEKMATALKARTVQKEYVARVKGKFPDGVVVCDQPIMQVSPKLGLNRVRATGKEATTKFRRLAYYPPEAAMETESSSDDERPATPPAIFANESEGYSIVHCFPLTGRTHQIRVHLQFLGHPITNDPIYSNRRVFGPELGKAEVTAERDEEIVARLSLMGKTEIPDTVSYRTHLTAAPNVPPNTDPVLVNEIMHREQMAAAEDYEKRKGERLSGNYCEVCGTELYSDPGPHELGIFLHAVAYADKDDWVPAAEGEEIVIGHGTVPAGLGDDDYAADAKTGTVLVEGVGIVNISDAAAKMNRSPCEATEAAAATN